MYLKTIEITGFKSFADRMRLQLKPGVTGIVGPNGCGKSNVVESIRWCMGEGSWKSLRSQSMADVIFNGTSRRSPHSMAEVLLTFDNTEPLLPVDFTEVTVARRIFRSGESEYYLNKVQCRRKDIQELFLDTGIGEEGYSIIDQGKVEFVLSSKPEDRRALFEEAAGVSKFRAKRHEATLKLDRVETDINRLNDNLALILDQIKKLDAAARKARQYQRLREELAAMEITALVFDLLGLDKAVAAEEEALAPLKERFERLQSDLAAAQAELAALNLRKAGRESEVMEGGQRVSEVKSEMARLEERVKAVEERKVEAERRRAELGAKVAEAETILSQPDPEVAQLKERCAALSGELEAARAESADFEATLAAEGAEVSRLEAEFKAAETRFLNVSEGVIAAARRMSQAQSEAAHRQADVRAAQKDQERAEARIADLDGRLAAARAGAESLARALEKAKGLETLAEQRREWLQGSRQRSGRRLGEARERLAEAQARYETAKGTPQPLFISAAQSVIEAGIPGVLGRVSELLRPEPGAGPAIKEALGERWQSVVCRSFQDAQTAIEHLNQAGGGRCRFLVLDSLPAEFPAPAEPPLNARRLLDQVRCEPEFDRLARYLLQEAYTQGRAVHGRHWVCGGSEDAAAQAAVWPDLGELKAAATACAAEEAAATAEEAQLVRELEACETECRGLRAGHQEADKAEHAAQAGLANLETDARLAREELALIQKQLAEQAGVVEAALAEAQRQEQAHVALLAEEKSLEEAAHALRGGLESAKDAWNAKRLRGAELSGAVMRLEGQLSYAQSQIARREAERLALSQARERMLADIEDMRRNEEGFAALRAELDAETGRCLEETARREEAYRALLEKLEQARVAVAAQEESIRGLQGEQEALREQIHSADIRLGQKRSQREAVVAKLQEGFNLTPEEAMSKAGGEAPAPEVLIQSRRRLENMGPVNMAAPEEYEELEKKHEFLKTQVGDLQTAREDLKAAIAKINATTRENFRQTFEDVRTHFRRLYGVLFEGGEADLVLTNPDDILETGIDILAQPPGKKLQSITLMSGGEKAMTAAALLFSFFSVRPSPFCMLDEVDAALDEANVERFVKLLKEFAQRSQFLIISHNKRTMEAADVIYGVTMEEQGVSQMISVELNKRAETPRETAPREATQKA